jgi:hypothetical protein
MQKHSGQGATKEKKRYTAPKCKHGITKKCCKDPSCGGGAALCKFHGKYKANCRDVRCGGGGKCCPHKVDKRFCKIPECGGGQAFCKHSTDKRLCYQCGGSFICISCKLTGVRKKGNQCYACNPTTKTRGRYKETRIASLLQKWSDMQSIPKFTTWNKTISMADKAACGRVFPDFTFEFHNMAIILEVDEFQHKRSGYKSRCDLVRMQDIVNSYGMLPVCIIRYNPDRCRIAGGPVYPVAEEKHEILLNCMKDAISQEIWNDHITLHYICYDCTECASVDSCPLIHTKTFATMFEFASYIEKTAPLVPFTPV